MLIFGTLRDIEVVAIPVSTYLEGIANPVPTPGAIGEPANCELRKRLSRTESELECYRSLYRYTNEQIAELVRLLGSGESVSITDQTGLTAIAHGATHC